MVRTMTIIGARPQFIKAAPIIKLLENDTLVHTGQHYDHSMSEIFFEGLDLPKPQHNLRIGSSSHAHQTGEMMIALEDVMLAERPDLVIVYGDTNSTLAGALVASKLHIPIMHVEAGLRSFNMAMPEEVNRVVTDRISNYLICPTLEASINLRSEGRTHDVYALGDTMLDLLIEYKGKYNKSLLKTHGLAEKDYYLCTLHRPANVDDGDCLKNIFNGFEKLGKQVIFPMHPRTRKMIKRLSIDIPRQVIVIDPVSYIDMITLTAAADKVFTDSGGLQKEAFMLRTHCVTLRSETEWVETVKAGWNRLCEIDADGMCAIVKGQWPVTQDAMPYGDGTAAKKVVGVINGI